MLNLIQTILENMIGYLEKRDYWYKLTREFLLLDCREYVQ